MYVNHKPYFLRLYEKRAEHIVPMDYNIIYRLVLKSGDHYIIELFETSLENNCVDDNFRIYTMKAKHYNNIISVIKDIQKTCKTNNIQLPMKEYKYYNSHNKIECVDLGPFYMHDPVYNTVALYADQLVYDSIEDDNALPLLKPR